MTPKRHAIAKEIIKLLYPGPPFGGELFLIDSATLAAMKTAVGWLTGR